MTTNPIKPRYVRIVSLIVIVQVCILPFILFSSGHPKAGPICLFLTVPLTLLIIQLVTGKMITWWLVPPTREKTIAVLVVAAIFMVVEIVTVIWFFKTG